MFLPRRAAFLYSSPLVSSRLQGTRLPQAFSSPRTATRRALASTLEHVEEHQEASPAAAKGHHQADHAQHVPNDKEDQLQKLLHGGLRVTTAAHLAWKSFLRPGDFVVDATLGNGGDLIFLAKCIGKTGRILAFDVQEQAVQSSTAFLDYELPREQQPRIDYVLSCHSTMREHIPAGVAPALICFNLGYLPFAERSVKTEPETTEAALCAGTEVLKPGGLLSVISYLGHEGGVQEHKVVTAVAAGLPPNRWTCTQHCISNRPTAPVLTLLWKRP